MGREELYQILDAARWAPSGDNTQPWRFQILNESQLVVHGFDTRDHCVYDFEGRPSQIAVGALLENIRIAASQYGLAASVTRRLDSTEHEPIFDVRFVAAAAEKDALGDYIRIRSVQRRPLSTKPLDSTQRKALSDSLGPDYRVVWFDSWAKRTEVARLLWSSAKLRLTIPEAYAVHAQVIAWRVRYSEDRVPEKAIGIDPLGARLMQWVMQSWERVEFFNRYLGGTLLPRLQLDLMPGLLCATHFAIVPGAMPANIDDYVTAGRAMQRFWLTATRLGLQLQPEMTPLIFAAYARTGKAFSTKAHAMEQAQSVGRRFSALVGEHEAARATFFGRLGHGRPAAARSTRLPLERLLIGAPLKACGRAQPAQAEKSL